MGALAALREAAADWRNRMVQSAAFQRLAWSSPLTRWVARRQARALFDLVAGFVYSQALAAAVELELCEQLAAGPRARDALGAALGLDAQAARTLLRACESLRLLEPRSGGRVALGPLGAALLGAAGVREMVRHHRSLYSDLADPAALLRRPRGAGAMAQYWAYAGREAPAAADPERVADYSALMAASQPMVAAQALASGALRGLESLLDVGGGEGAFLEAVGAARPGLRLGLFDLPAVTERARARLAAAGLEARTALHAGDFLRDPLPKGFAAVSLVRVLHDHDDAEAARILAAAHAALEPGGRLLVIEPMAEAPGARAVGGAYFGFYLHAMGRGRPRSPQELRALLREAGFQRLRLAPAPLPLAAQVLTAEA
jgi:demethylspheroidene O-methyltransferase